MSGKSWILLGLLSIASPVFAEDKKLTDLDRKLLIEKLAEVQNTSTETVESKLKGARSAFRSAIRSDDAAYDLYLLSVEKTLFTDEAKKGQEFREWKRRHKSRRDSPGFRRALRHQLHWLHITLEVAEEPDLREEIGVEVKDAIDALLKSAEVLEPEDRKLLKQSVLQSAFAKAYRLDELKIKDWPLGPLNIAEMYEKIILPPFRKPDRLAELQTAWVYRIKQQEAFKKEWSEEGSVRGVVAPDFHKWITKERPALIWKMEVDLYKAGDEKASALRMLGHIEKHLSHQHAPRWITEFKKLINPKEEE